MYILPTNCKFTLSNSLYQQTDGCTMNGLLCVTFSNSYMVNLENDIALSLKPKFYRRYADHKFNRNKITPRTFLLMITQLLSKTTTVGKKSTKLPKAWSCKAPKRYKRNVIIGDLH